MSIVEIENQPGRPPIKIDLSQAEQLCQLGCTLREVAGFFKCSDDTIQRVLKREREQTWSEFYDMHSAGGDISIRRAQYQRAVGGDVKMLIWLGKQRLGQSDKNELDITSKGKPIVQSALLPVLTLKQKKQLLEARKLLLKHQEGGTNG